MFKLNSIFKIVIVMFLSLVIPSFLSIFKVSFDEYVAAEEANVQGASVVKVKTVNNKNSKNSTDQSVLVDFKLPKIGAIQNLSQRPFKFPKPQQTPVSAPVNDSSAFEGELEPLYDLTDDGGRGSNPFLFSFNGVGGDSISFYNGNDYDMNNVRIEIHWSDNTNDYTSVYSTYKIEPKLYFYESLVDSSEASIPYNPSFIIKSFAVFFNDNTGKNFTARF